MIGNAIRFAFEHITEISVDLSAYEAEVLIVLQALKLSLYTCFLKVPSFRKAKLKLTLKKL